MVSEAEKYRAEDESNKQKIEAKIGPRTSSPVVLALGLALVSCVLSVCFPTLLFPRI
jgi:hypothetical protein